MPVAHEFLGDPVQPRVEHGRARRTQRLPGSGRLQRDRGDGTAVAEIRLLQRLGGQAEPQMNSPGKILGPIEYEVDQPLIALAGTSHGFDTQLFLPTREEVIERPHRCRTRGRDLLQPGAGIALLAKQRRTGIEQTVAGIGDARHTR
ncbi:hypothetical protein GCM10023319_77120 [Nocardia iowensis]